jgi:hypothetical protein
MVGFSLLAELCALFGVDAWGDFLLDAGRQVGGAGAAGAAGAGAAGAAGSTASADAGRSAGGGAGSSYGDRGFAYGSGPIHSSPSSDSSVVGQVPGGSRVIYTETTSVNGETWYRVNPPGGSSGWMPGSQTSPTRPQALPPGRPTNVVGSGTGLANVSSAQTSGSRG